MTVSSCLKWRQKDRELRDQHFLPLAHHSAELPLITVNSRPPVITLNGEDAASVPALLKSLGFKVYLAVILICPSSNKRSFGQTAPFVALHCKAPFS